MKPNEVCRTLQERIPDYCADDLPPTQKAECDSHFAGCPTCRVEVDKQRRLVSAMRSHFANQAPVTRPVRLPEAAGESPIELLWNWLARHWLATGASFAVLTVIVLSVLMVPESPSVATMFSKIEHDLAQERQAGAIELLTGTVQIVSTEDSLAAKSVLAPAQAYRVLQPALLRFPGGSTIRLKPQTRFHVGLDSLSLTIGQADCTIRAGKNGFRVQTPTATLGIRGTEFSVVTASGGTIVDLRVGRIEIETPRGCVDLNAGSSLLALPDAPPRLVGTNLLAAAGEISPTDLETPAFWQSQRDRWQAGLRQAPRPPVPPSPPPAPEIPPENPPEPASDMASEPVSEPVSEPGPVGTAASGPPPIFSDGFPR